MAVVEKSEWRTGIILLLGYGNYYYIIITLKGMYVYVLLLKKSLMISRIGGGIQTEFYYNMVRYIVVIYSIITFLFRN